MGQLARPRVRPAARPDANAAARQGVRGRERSHRGRAERLRRFVRDPALASRRRPPRPGLGATARRRRPGPAVTPEPMTVASAALLLFLILDPLGNVPVFL